MDQFLNNYERYLVAALIKRGIFASVFGHFNEGNNIAVAEAFGNVLQSYGRSN
jgi:hypothetical protein